jgi:hypothetical protein
MIMRYLLMLVRSVDVRGQELFLEKGTRIHMAVSPSIT